MRCTNRSVVYARQPTILHLPKHLCNSSGVITAHTPSGLEKCLLAQFSHDSCYVEFVPGEIGEWFFTTSSPVSSPTSLSSSPTSFSSSPPPSLPSASPFKTKVFDQVGVCVILPSQHVVGFLVPFLVDATQVKDIRRLKIRVEDNRRQIPTEIKETWGVLEGSFRVRKPCQPLFYVEYDGQHVIGSPFQIFMHPETIVNFEVKKFLTRVNRSCKVDVTFNRPLRDEDEDDVMVLVSNSHSRDRNIKVVAHIPDNTFNQRIIFSFVPTIVGDHQIEGFYKGVSLGSPVVCRAYDPAEVRVVYVQQEAEVECIFDVDISKAGEGVLEVLIDDGKTEYNMKKVGKGLYRVTLDVNGFHCHKVDLFFNSEPVPGCPFTMKMKKSESVERDKEERRPQIRFTASIDPCNTDSQVIYAPVNQKCTFKIVGRCRDLCVISVDIIEVASRRRVRARLSSLNPDYDLNECTVTFSTQNVGDHTSEVMFNGVKVGSLPFNIKSFDVSKVKVDGREGCFVVDAKDAGEGVMMFLLQEEGKKLKAKSDVEVMDQGAFQITPVLSGNYRLHVFLNQKAVAGSPFLLKSIKDTPKSKKKVRFDLRSDLHLNQRSCIDLRIPDVSDDGVVYIDVTDDKDRRIPHLTTKKYPSLYSIELTPEKVGKVKVRVKKEGWQDVVLETSVESIDGGVRRKEPSTYEGYEFPTTKLLTDKITNILLERSKPLQANKKATIDLRLSIPSKHDDVIIDVTDDKGRRITHVTTKKYPSLYSIELTPEKVGKVEVRVKKKGWQDVAFEVPVQEGEEWKPESVGCSHGGLEREVEGEPCSVVCSGGGLEKGVVGEASSFVVDTGRKRRKDLVVEVEGPNSVGRVLMEAISRSAYKVTYIPREVGRFTVSVKCDGSHVAGSPFEALIIDPTKVTYVGGFESWVDSVSKVFTLYLGQATKIELTCTNAGPGSISGELLYNNGVVELLDVYEDGDLIVVVVVPVFEGNHLMQIYLEDQIIPHCPIRALVHPRTTSISSNDNRVYVCGRGLKEAIVNQKAFFMIDATRAGPGEAKVNLIGSKGNENVFITAVKHTVTGSLYKGEYVVPQLGSYLLEIKWCNREIKESPFKVTALQGTQASKVECGGDGLKKGVVGEDNEVFIDCRLTDAIGSLKVECRGRTQDAVCRLTKHTSHSYLLYYTPAEAGRHQLHILYDGQHVPGSPFEVRVSNIADASKVRVFGPGVEMRSKLEGFKGVFFADTSGAGVGQLVVRVKGPKGSFCVEMHKLQHRLVACRYDPRQAGNYLVQVKWSGNEVKGSPFKVKLVT